jgi:magnesium transporter
MPVSRESARTEQMSLFFGKDYVLTIQEQYGDFFDPIRERVRSGRPRLRQGGTDYLVYALLDALVDSYFPVLQFLGQQLDEIEEEIHDNPDKSHSQRLNELKRDLVSLRRYVWPLREVVDAMIHEDNELVTDETRLYLRDCLDHAVHAYDLIESYREIANGLMDLYLSIMSQRMNEVMKVLTIIATLFIPLSFIAGLYGMNFDTSASRWNMPELSWPFGYPLVLAIMGLCGGGMLFYFWRKGWFR